MPISSFALDYEACEVSELQSFIKARTRTRKDPRPDQPKKYYVHALRKRDQRARFRFFDLAPELRNLIYRELLIWPVPYQPGGRRSCFHQILASCRQAHREAGDILYAENTEVVQLSTCMVASCGRIGRSLNHYAEWTTCLEATEWPAHLHRFNKLAITMALDRPAFRFLGTLNAPDAVSINNMLYSLVNFLQVSEELETMTVTVTGEREELDDKTFTKMLWPLTKLAKHVKGAPSVTGAPAAVVATLQERCKVARTEKTVDFVARYRSLEQRMEAYENLAAEVGFETPARSAIWRFGEIVKAVAKDSRLVTGAWEAERLRAMRRVESALDGAEGKALVAAVEERLKQLEQQGRK